MVDSAWGGVWLKSPHFPERWRGALLQNQTETYQGIRSYQVAASGAGYQLKAWRKRFLKSVDPNFRPVAMAVGPDGALYLLDAYNPMLSLEASTMHDPRRAHSHGRVWRIQVKGRRAHWRPPTAGAPILELLERFRESDPGNRTYVRQQLWQRDEAEVIAELLGWLEGLEAGDPDQPRLELEALWLHQAYQRVNEDLLRRVIVS